MKEKHILTFDTTDLASRSLAKAKRDEVELLLSKGTDIIFDFHMVESISGSYADELFGVLALKHGRDSLLSQIKLRNCKERCLEVVAESILERTKEPKAIAA